MASQVKAHPFVDLHARFLRHGAADETKEDVARRMDCSRQVRSMEGNNNNTIESVGVLRLTEYLVLSWKAVLLYIIPSSRSSVISS